MTTTAIRNRISRANMTDIEVKVIKSICEIELNEQTGRPEEVFGLPDEKHVLTVSFGEGELFIEKLRQALVDKIGYELYPTQFKESVRYGADSQSLYYEQYEDVGGSEVSLETIQENSDQTECYRLCYYTIRIRDGAEHVYKQFEPQFRLFNVNP